MRTTAPRTSNAAMRPAFPNGMISSRCLSFMARAALRHEYGENSSSRSARSTASLRRRTTSRSGVVLASSRSMMKSSIRSKSSAASSARTTRNSVTARNATCLLPIAGAPLRVGHPSVAAPPGVRSRYLRARNARQRLGRARGRRLAYAARRHRRVRTKRRNRRAIRRHQAQPRQRFSTRARHAQPGGLRFSYGQCNANVIHEQPSQGPSRRPS